MKINGILAKTFHVLKGDKFLLALEIICLFIAILLIVILVMQILNYSRSVVRFIS